ALAGPAVGAVLIGLALAAPFAAAAGLYLSGALLMLGLQAARQVRGPQRAMGAALAEGIAFLKAEPFLRQLVWITGAWNLFADMALIALVLHAQENLGLSAPAYGLILAAGAVGGVAGGFAGSLAVRRIGPGRTAQIGSVLGIPCFLVAAFVPNAIVLALALAVFEFSGLLWNTVSTAFRQRRVPDPLRGRVHGIYRLVSFAAMPLGMVLSGLLVEGAGLVLPRHQALIVPFVVAALGLVGLNLLVWSRIGRGFGGRGPSPAPDG
ncbi:MAG: MFS transporter, partial [Pseudomonadota bacterium]